MSTTYQAYTVIGIKIPTDKLFQSIQERMCKHPVKSTKYCPECGSSMWAEQTKPIKIYKQDNQTIAGMGYVTTGYYYNKIYVGTFYIADADVQEYSAPISDILAIRTALKAKLEPLNLWDESAFGIHTLLYIG